jgi:hypothetical protein
MNIEPRMKPLSDCRSIEDVVEPETLEENVEACREVASFEKSVDDSIRQQWLDHCNNILFETEAFFYYHLKPFEWSYHVANMPKTASVYFVRTEEGELVKIGKSVNFENRLSSLKTSVQSDVSIISLLPVHPEILNATERYFHQHFSEKRIRREWFAISDAEIESAISQFDYDQMAQLNWTQSTGISRLHTFFGIPIFELFAKRFEYLLKLEAHWIKNHGGSKLRFVISDHPDPNPRNIFSVV